MSTPREIAKTILAGFDRHYRLFRTISAGALKRFEKSDWKAVASANRQRIQMYDQRVHETVSTILTQFPEAETSEQMWPNVKRAFVSLLYEHLRPELAETFYNSVACRVLHRSYYDNRYIFWRPATSTNFIEGEEPTYRCFYPGNHGLRRALLGCVTSYRFKNQFCHLRYDIRCLIASTIDYFPNES